MVVVRHNLAIFHDSVDFVLVTLGEPILDESTERKGLLARDLGTLVGALLSASNLSVMKILLEQNVWVVVDVSSLDIESAVLQSSFVAVVESILAGVLLSHAWVTTVEGEVREVRHRSGWMDVDEKAGMQQGAMVLYVRRAALLVLAPACHHGIPVPHRGRICVSTRHSHSSVRLPRPMESKDRLRGSFIRILAAAKPYIWGTSATMNGLAPDRAAAYEITRAYSRLPVARPNDCAAAGTQCVRIR